MGPLYSPERGSARNVVTKFANLNADNMKTKNVLTWLLAIAGEALIVAGFLIFFLNLLSTGILVLDIIVTSIIYWLFFIDLLKPVNSPDDPSQKRIANLGVRWFFVILYDVLAVGAMITFACLFIPFKIQLVVQLGLLLLVLFGLLLASRSAARAQSVWADGQNRQVGRENMREAMQELKNAADMSENVPQPVKDEIALLCEEIRYIAPANTQQALELEDQFVDAVRQVQFALYDYNMNQEMISTQLSNCKRFIQQRKSIYSN